jgi:hypothetical protein
LAEHLVTYAIWGVWAENLQEDPFLTGMSATPLCLQTLCHAAPVYGAGSYLIALIRN